MTNEQRNRASWQSFVELVGNPITAQEFEAQTLSIGDDLLPELARRVRDNQTTDDEDLSGYWRWLCGQWAKASES